MIAAAARFVTDRAIAAPRVVSAAGTVDGAGVSRDVFASVRDVVCHRLAGREPEFVDACTQTPGHPLAWQAMEVAR